MTSISKNDEIFDHSRRCLIKDNKGFIYGKDSWWQDMNLISDLRYIIWINQFFDNFPGF